MLAGALSALKTPDASDGVTTVEIIVGTFLILRSNSLNRTGSVEKSLETMTDVPFCIESSTCKYQFGNPFCLARKRHRRHNLAVVVEFQKHANILVLCPRADLNIASERY